MPLLQNQVQHQVARPTIQTRRNTETPPFNNTAFTHPVGSTMSMTQFDNLPFFVCKGGSQWKMGRGRNFVCVLCLTVGHTFEYCSTHNGFVEGGLAVTSDPRTRAAGGTLAITSQ